LSISGLEQPVSDQTYEALQQKFQNATYLELSLSERLAAEALFLAMPNFGRELFSHDILVNLLERCRESESNS
jgi:hypothetical protein